MAAHSSILAWRIPWTEEPGGLYSSWGSQELDTTEQGYDPCKIGPAHVPGSNVPGLTGRSHLGPQSPPLPSASLMLRLGVGCHLLEHFRLVFFS